MPVGLSICVLVCMSVGLSICVLVCMVFVGLSICVLVCMVFVNLCNRINIYNASGRETQVLYIFINKVCTPIIYDQNCYSSSNSLIPTVNVLLHTFLVMELDPSSWMMWVAEGMRPTLMIVLTTYLVSITAGIMKMQE